MIKVIGMQGCSKCEMTKRILTSKNIEFEYSWYENLESSEQENLTEMARKFGNMTLPLILKDDALVQLKDVID